MNNILNKLYADNESVSRSFVISNSSDSETRIDLYDVIDDYYGVSATAFVNALNGIKEGAISLHINSPGGDVFAARAMVAAISAHPSNITAHIDGLAASAASYIAIACDSVVMQEGSMMMVHCASTMTWGNADSMRSTADLLEKIDGTISSDYAKKTGKPQDEMLALMSAETWLTADEAVDMGLADSVAVNSKSKTKASNTWNLSAYTNAPKPIENTVAVPVVDPVSIPEQVSATQTNRNKLRLIESF